MAETINTPQNRLISLDAFRGFTMFWIIGGGRIMQSLPSVSDNAVFRWLASQFVHPEWIGFTCFDLIFPFFLFIIGVTLPFSYRRRLEKGESKSALYKHIIIRSITLFILGLICFGYNDPGLTWLGYYGVLQLLAVGYLVASFIMLNTSIKGIVLWVVGILSFSFVIMMFISVPGYGAGNFSQDGNFSEYISRLVTEYIGVKWRVLLSPFMLNPMVTALSGVLAGYWLKSNKAATTKVYGFLIAGAILIPASLGLALIMPIIKNLWTVSFTLLASGLAALTLALFYWLIDIRGYKRWAFPFIIIGLNPITIYLLARFVDFQRIAIFLTYGFLDKLPAQDFFLQLVVTALHLLVVFYLYRQKIFIKI